MDGTDRVKPLLVDGTCAPEVAEVTVDRFAAYSHPDDLAANLLLFAQLVAGEIDHFEMEKRFIRKDGGILSVDLTASLVRDVEGNPDYAIGTTRDITYLKRLESELHATEEVYRLLVEQVPAVVYIAEPGATGRWHYVSQQIEAMLGFSVEEWTGDRGLWMQRLHPDDQPDILADEDHIVGSQAVGSIYSGTYRLLHRNGATVWVRDDAIMLRDKEGRDTWRGVLVDVTREKLLEERLEYQATHDGLTGLPNRKFFHDRVGDALLRRQPGQVAVLFIDLDNFKIVNDSFGHGSGDEVMVAVAKRLLSCSGDGDTAARIGGDEFALVVEGVTAGQMTALADRIADALSTTPVQFSRHALTIGASVGIALAGPGETTESLLRNADLAMYAAKLEGRGRHVLYEPTMHASVVNRFRLEAALPGAIADGALSLSYQPIVDLRTGAVVGHEALARWSDSDLGPVPPDEFIPVAEETGLIHELGQWAIDRACGDLRLWRSARDAEAYVSVNVSPCSSRGTGSRPRCFACCRSTDSNRPLSCWR